MPDIENHMVTEQDELNAKGIGYIDECCVGDEDE